MKWYPNFSKQSMKEAVQKRPQNWTKLNLCSLQWQTELAWEICGASDSYITFSSDGQDCVFRNF